MIIESVTKRILQHSITLIFVPLFCTSVFAATKNASINVSASLLNACEAGTSSSGTLSFGTLSFGTIASFSSDIKITGDVNTGAIRVQCNSGTNVKIVMGGGNSGNPQSRHMTLFGGLGQVRYNIFTSSDYSTIWDSTTGVSFTATGSEQWIPTYALVYANQLVLPGAYTDSVPVTISW